MSPSNRRDHHDHTTIAPEWRWTWLRDVDGRMLVIRGTITEGIAAVECE